MISESPVIYTKILTYPISVEQREDGSWSAWVTKWPNYHVEAESGQEAIALLQRQMQIPLVEDDGEPYLRLEISSPYPWITIIGSAEDDPFFDEVMAFIEADRRELDREVWGEDFFSEESEAV
jgi:predicted RNase H-like HicB family nuclease